MDSECHRKYCGDDDPSVVLGGTSNRVYTSFRLALSVLAEMNNQHLRPLTPLSAHFQDDYKLLRSSPIWFFLNRLAGPPKVTEALCSNMSIVFRMNHACSKHESDVGVVMINILLSNGWNTAVSWTRDKVTLVDELDVSNIRIRVTWQAKDQ